MVTKRQAYQKPNQLHMPCLGCPVQWCTLAVVQNISILPAALQWVKYGRLCAVTATSRTFSLTSSTMYLIRRGLRRPLAISMHPRPIQYQKHGSTFSAQPDHSCPGTRDSFALCDHHIWQQSLFRKQSKLQSWPIQSPRRQPGLKKRNARGGNMTFRSCSTFCRNSEESTSLRHQPLRRNIRKKCQFSVSQSPGGPQLDRALGLAAGAKDCFVSQMMTLQQQRHRLRVTTLREVDSIAVAEQADRLQDQPQPSSSFLSTIEGEPGGSCWCSLLLTL